MTKFKVGDKLQYLNYSSQYNIEIISILKGVLTNYYEIQSLKEKIISIETQNCIENNYKLYEEPKEIAKITKPLYATIWKNNENKLCAGNLNNKKTSFSPTQTNFVGYLNTATQTIEDYNGNPVMLEPSLLATLY